MARIAPVQVVGRLAASAFFVPGNGDAHGGFDPVLDSAGRIRPAAEHIGYTWIHLPGINCRPEPPRKAEAREAILAARIARSSLEIRSRLK